MKDDIIYGNTAHLEETRRVVCAGPGSTLLTGAGQRAGTAALWLCRLDRLTHISDSSQGPNRVVAGALAVEALPHPTRVPPLPSSPTHRGKGHFPLSLMTPLAAGRPKANKRKR